MDVFVERLECLLVPLLEVVVEVGEGVLHLEVGVLDLGEAVTDLEVGGEGSMRWSRLAGFSEAGVVVVVLGSSREVGRL